MKVSLQKFGFVLMFVGVATGGPAIAQVNLQYNGQYNGQYTGQAQQPAGTTATQPNNRRDGLYGDGAAGLDSDTAYGSRGYGRRIGAGVEGRQIGLGVLGGTDPANGRSTGSATLPQQAPVFSSPGQATSGPNNCVDGAGSDVGSVATVRRGCGY